MGNNQQQQPAGKGEKNDIEKFIQCLDELNVPKSKEAIKNRAKGSPVENTLNLLKAGDEVFNSDEYKDLRQLINEQNLQPKISGNSYIEEQFPIGGNGTLKRPVIDLVQQGGTMLGIGLLGYTYIMEKAGIRFRSMAGTSAGAINTLLLASLPQEIYKHESPFFADGRQACKSEFLAYMVANKNFIDFLDRPGFIGWFQKLLVLNITSIEKYRKLIGALLVLMLFGASFGIYMFINRRLFTTANGLTENEVRIYDFVTGTVGITLILVFLIMVLLRLFKQNMGLNMGNEVYNWMKGILETDFVNIHTTTDLKLRKKNETPVTYNPPANELNKPAEPFAAPRLVFISANLTHNRIVKFPDNTQDYWKKEYAGLVTPAAFVRASMSLPFIFYSFIPYDAYVQEPSNLLPVDKTKERRQYVDTISLFARFVDGGMLSNFPIREFHVPPHIDPRYPTFGVLLSALQSGNAASKNKSQAREHKQTEEEKLKEEKKKWLLEKDKFFNHSVFKFIISFISTFRRFYDGDFLTNHPEFSHLVKAVDTKKFNSLDFGMKPETKKELFAAGARTAMNQLAEFKWEKYLEERKNNTNGKQN